MFYEVLAFTTALSIAKIQKQLAKDLRQSRNKIESVSLILNIVSYKFYEWF